jgi:hypothetical protein
MVKLIKFSINQQNISIFRTFYDIFLSDNDVLQENTY